MNNIDEFKKLGVEWEKLNEEYDGKIQKYIDNPSLTPMTPEEMEACKELQKKIFDLENRLFDILCEK